jgi:hypothetical protein
MTCKKILEQWGTKINKTEVTLQANWPIAISLQK